MFRHPLHQETAQCCFSGADFSCNEDKTPIIIDTVLKMGQGLPMLLAHEKISGIRRQGERFFFQSEMFAIHCFTRITLLGNCSAQKKRRLFLLLPADINIIFLYQVVEVCPIFSGRLCSLADIASVNFKKMH